MAYRSPIWNGPSWWSFHQKAGRWSRQGFVNELEQIAHLTRNIGLAEFILRRGVTKRSQVSIATRCPSIFVVVAAESRPFSWSLLWMQFLKRLNCHRQSCWRYLPYYTKPVLMTVRVLWAFESLGLPSIRSEVEILTRVSNLIDLGKTNFHLTVNIIHYIHKCYRVAHIVKSSRHRISDPCGCDHQQWWSRFHHARAEVAVFLEGTLK